MTLYSLDVIPPKGDPYWKDIRLWAKELKSDGCSFATEAFKEACLEHDCHWWTGETLWGTAVSIQAANDRFRAVMRSRSRFGKYSPMAFWRWAAVSVRGVFK